MSAVKLEGDWRKFERFLAEIPRASMYPIHVKVGAVVLKNTQKRFRAQQDPDGKSWPRPRWRKGVTMRDTGVLLRSIHAKASVESATVGTNNEYARAHQFGMVIRPRDAKMLAIPWSKEAKGYGYARLFPKGRLFPIMTKRGKGWLAEDKGKKMILHYLLRDKVKEPERRILGITDADREGVEKIVTAFLKSSIK